MQFQQVMSSSISHLPESLLLEIISRLPDAKSAVRCKCVCKLWSSSISLPNLIPFIKHDPSFTIIIQQRDIGRTCVYVHPLPDRPMSFPQCHYLDTYLGFLPLPQSSRLLRLEAFFNDLLLVSVGDSGLGYRYYYICDPLTQRFTRLPRLKIGVPTQAGLVFDSPTTNTSSSQYRVVELNRRTELLISIYSSESGDWREYRVGRHGDRLVIDSPVSPRTFAYNGKLHWLMQSDDKFTVMAIDPFLDPAAAEPCFYEIAISSDGDLSGRDLNLASYMFGVFRGRLQLIVTLTPAGGDDCEAIWVWEIEKDYTACHLSHKVLWKDILSKNSSLVERQPQLLEPSYVHLLALHPYNLM